MGDMDLRPEPLSDRRLFLEGMTTLQEHAAAQLAFSHQLAQLLHASPARMSIETISTNKPVLSAYELGEAQSIGVLNWSSVTIQVGFAGRSATAGNGIAVPPASWLVLPLECNMIDVGADQADLALVGEAHVGLIRFEHRQELAAGSLGGISLPVGDTLSETGQVTNPGAGGAIVTLNIPTPGVYRVLAGGCTADNLAYLLQLKSGATVFGKLVVAGFNFSNPTVFDRLTLPAGPLTLVAPAAIVATVTSDLRATRIA